MIKDIYPTTPVSALEPKLFSKDLALKVPVDLVSAVTGLSKTFIKKATSKKGESITIKDVLLLLDLDAFSETFIPRSRIPRYLIETIKKHGSHDLLGIKDKVILLAGSAPDLIRRLPDRSVQCVVTSTPYWGTRIYETNYDVSWADGEVCPFGHEQSPEGFIRHSVELLFLLSSKIKLKGSIWWNLMDTYNTRTQIRSNAAETLRAMQGKDKRGWKDHSARRYSAGHSFLKDGEICFIPYRIAERASRIGYWSKSIITWKKTGSMPETVDSRVTREIEYIIHLSLDRAPLFNKALHKKVPPEFGGRNLRFESEKLTDIWCLSTSSGKGGHGAQFPLALPGRCISLSTNDDDLVLDPFIGSGTTALAALQLNRRCIGFDISKKYLDIARDRIDESLHKSKQPKLFEL